MIGSRLAVTWRMMALAFVLPLLLILAIEITLSSGIQSFDRDVTFTRFANATLTAYTLCSIALLGNLFFYGESRNRPLAPLVGMHLQIDLLPHIAHFLLRLEEERS